MSAPLIRVCALKGTKCAAISRMSRPRNPYFSLARMTIDLPSGVSSASEASCAASANRSFEIPGAGVNSVAIRFPSVIVPVLSRRSTSTSPAASMARPDVAITLWRIILSIPAMPIAERSPPMVVGIKQTRSATSTVTVTGAPCPATSTLNNENGRSVIHTIRKIMVNAASNMLSAISLGVFCRLAPSIK